MKTVIVIAGKRRDEITAPLTSADVDHYIIDSEVGSFPHKLRQLMRMLRMLTAKRGRFIVVADYPGYFALGALLLCRLTRTPYVMRLRGDVAAAIPQWTRGMRRALRLAAMRFVLARSSLVLVVSATLASHVSATNHLEEGRVMTVTVPLVPKERQEHEARDLRDPSPIQRGLTHDLRLITVTNLNFRGKELGLEVFLPILQEVISHRRDVRWEIAGDGRLLPRFRNALDAFPSLHERVSLLGYLSPIGPLLQTADLFVYFSFEDGCPNAVLEAQAAEDAVLVNTYPPLLELIHDGETGYVVNPRDTKGSVARILEILASPDERARVGRKAKRRVIEEHSLRRVGRDFRRALERL